MELKPCPFCGGSVTLTVMIGDWYEDGEDTGLSSYGWIIRHSKHNRECSSTRSFSSEAFLDAACRESEEAKQKLITAWNTRHVETCRNVNKEWEKTSFAHAGTSFCCSECGAHYVDTESYYAGLAGKDEWQIRTNYCPSCGRKVEGC